MKIGRRLIYIIAPIAFGKIQFIFAACNVKINVFNNLKADVMKKRIVLAIFSLNALWMPTVGYAQYVGPTAQLPANSIAEILKKPIDDQKVVVKGHLLRKVSNKRYIFTDGNAEIRVKIDQTLFGAKRIDDKTTVEISGEVETEFMKSPEIDVGSISVLP